MDKIDAFFQTINFPSFYLKVILSFITSLLITYYSIPTIIKISRRKNLMDEPGQRSSHERKINNKVNAGCKKTISCSYLNNIQIYNFFNR